MIIERELTPHLQRLAKQFSAVAVMGPRQSGKTTLVRQTFPDYAFVSLEDIDRRLAAKSDPRGFLAAYSSYKGLIIDEVQEVPELLSYMQGVIDSTYRPGFFIITGSQNFILYEKITQSLAGRIALLTLLPLSVSELKRAQFNLSQYETFLIKGGYPQLYSQHIDIDVWCSSYINTYVEKDVRQVLKITDVLKFQRFLKLCAARVGNQLNYADLARDSDISPHAAKEWISVLQTSYIIRILPPYYRNFNKRLTKHPKLYFYDTALVCALLNIRTIDQFFNHPFKGAIFESFVLSEIFKYNYNRARNPEVYFWRDSRGHEIDCIIELGLDNTVPLEIKASKTRAANFFDSLTQWAAISGQKINNLYSVYGGDESFSLGEKHTVAWHDINRILETMYHEPLR